MNCETCKYYLGDDDGTGLCRRYPPSFKNEETDDLIAFFPMTDNGNWCGEFKLTQEHDNRKCNLEDRQMKPKRIQRKRSKGWRKPAGAVYVGRGSKWGNPYTVKEFTENGVVGYSVFESGDDEVPIINFTRKYDAVLWATTLFRTGRDGINKIAIEVIKRELKGKDLMCWCSLRLPCHADVLIAVANS